MLAGHAISKYLVLVVSDDNNLHFAKDFYHEKDAINFWFDIGESSFFLDLESYEVRLYGSEEQSIIRTKFCVFLQKKDS